MKVLHEVWEDSEGLTGLCHADSRGDGARAMMEPGSKLIYKFYAESHYEAMTTYYMLMDWGEYTTEFEVDYLPYDY